MTSAIQPRPRPTSDNELGFARRKAVRWFSPPTLARAAAKVVLSAAFGDYLDKREMQSTLESRVLRAGAGSDDVWIDFIADTADGFNQTYSVAWCASQREIAPIGLDRKLPRAQLIVFGGDEVYPYATPKEYEDRFSGPYLAALPWTEPDSSRPQEKHARMLAIPGNHDWYDGLTGFMRLFAQADWIGGRELEQSRSYFAVDLPGPFWLWGIDIQSDNYVDALQIKYFKTAATQMTPDDALILCTAKPSWTDVRDAKDAYRNLAFVERTMVPPGVRTILMLSGDKHHYARYEAAKDVGPEGPRMRVTAGGGGAFLSTTQKLADPANVPRPIGDDNPATDDTEPFNLACRYPSLGQSRRLNGHIFSLGLRNPWFMLIPAIMYVLLFVSSVSRLGQQNNEITLDIKREPFGFQDFLVSAMGVTTLAIVFAVAAILSAFYIVPKRVNVGKSRMYRGLAGVTQTAAHVAAQAAIAMVCVQAFQSETLTGWRLLLCTLLIGLAGGIVGSLIFATFLFVVFTLFGWNSTEAFSSFRYSGYKNFLRIHVTKEAVTVYPIGIDNVCKKWDYDAGNTSAEAAWLKPSGGSIETRLIEPEFRILAPSAAATQRARAESRAVP
ncbi:hypothetical protein Mycsm_05062 [Mycobacterium sp. JS623]|uniref:metallophosphoesterase family protein n=1 Tax=Mycobacterium sp. JS623 TaxID=212767 RepID=UPI0002A5A8FA|nr:hypothetical protein [Mycobacterium sp. JS623]AGB25271.1 hypothetical protein Mycsm_05062 [Mycobacterium sp. JS623]